MTDQDRDSPGHVRSGSTLIPVRNLWLMMVYASKLYQESELLHGRDIERNPEDLFEVVAEILVVAIGRRLRRGLSREYETRSEVLTRVRGRIDMLPTETRQLLSQGRIECTYDELTVDCAKNRLFVQALEVAARRANPGTAQRARGLATTLVRYGVSQRPRGVRATVRASGRNDRVDAEAIAAARLLLEMAIPTEVAGAHRGRTPGRDAKAIGRLYEAAVRGFFRVSLDHSWTVAPGESQQRWQIESSSSGVSKILPVMKTDIKLEQAARRVIVETKFADALAPNRQGTMKLKRDHIFQIYAYIQSQHGTGELSENAEGVLLYPVVGEEITESMIVQGHRYRIMTVDLAADAISIRDRLLEVVT